MYFTIAGILTAAYSLKLEASLGSPAVTAIKFLKYST